MSIKHCDGCGQNLTKDRRGDPGLCEKCERAARAEELEEEVEELREQLEQAEGLEDRIIELLSLSLSPAQVLDVIFTQERGYSVSEWASKRRVTKPAVYNNLSTADPLIEEQSNLQEFVAAESVDLERERVEQQANEEAERDMQPSDGDPVGYQ